MLAIIISWSVNKKGTRKESQEWLKSDSDLQRFDISARKNNKPLALSG